MIHLTWWLALGHLNSADSHSHVDAVRSCRSTTGFQLWWYCCLLLLDMWLRSSEGLPALRLESTSPITLMRLALGSKWPGIVLHTASSSMQCTQSQCKKPSITTQLTPIWKLETMFLIAMIWRASGAMTPMDDLVKGEDEATKKSTERCQRNLLWRILLFAIGMAWTALDDGVVSNPSHWTEGKQYLNDVEFGALFYMWPCTHFPTISGLLALVLRIALCFGSLSLDPICTLASSLAKWPVTRALGSGCNVALWTLHDRHKATCRELTGWSAVYLKDWWWLHMLKHTNIDTLALRIPLYHTARPFIAIFYWPSVRGAQALLSSTMSRQSIIAIQDSSEHSLAFCWPWCCGPHNAMKSTWYRRSPAQPEEFRDSLPIRVCLTKADGDAF